MSFRAQTIYITSQTLKRLGLVLRLYPQKSASDREMTRDELADSLINEAIGQKYPDAIGLEKAIADAEKNFLKTKQTKDTK